MEILSRIGIEIDGRARTSVVVSYSLVGRSVLSAFNGATMIGESVIIAADMKYLTPQTRIRGHLLLRIVRTQ